MTRVYVPHEDIALFIPSAWDVWTFLGDVRMAQSGAITSQNVNKTIKALAMEGRKCMTLHPCTTSDCTVFMTSPEDHALVVSMGDLFGVKIIDQCGNTVGRVRGIDRGSVVARIVPDRLTLPRHRKITKAVATIRYTKLTQPVEVGLRKIVVRHE